MLVYANHLRVQGTDAERAVSKAIGGWLKEQLGFGLRPDQLKQDGEHNGHRGEHRSQLRIHACYDGEPALCAWVLKHADEDVRGRQWIVEVGVKKFAAEPLEVSCVVKTDERSTLVSNPVSASQPRVIQYIVKNVLSAKNADFADAVPGEIETSPVGVVVFEARTGALVSLNREAARIVQDLCGPGQSAEQLLGVITCRRAETVRAEEVVLSVPDGRSVTTLINATPIRDPDGPDDALASVVVTLVSRSGSQEWPEHHLDP